MPDTTSTKVIQYIAHIGDILRKLNTIESANKKVAGSLSQNFGKGFKKIGTGVGKISTEFTKFNKETGKFDKVGKSVQTFNSIIQDSDGSIKKVTESYKTSAKGAKSLSASVTDLSASQAKSAGLINPLIGKSSQLSTNFSKLTDVNQKFSKELTGVGKA